MNRERVLFVCTGNSARSQMAEALLRHRAGDRFESFSAGTEPKGLNPLTVKALEEIGVSTDGLWSKSTREYLGKVQMNYAIIVCDSAQQSCPSIQPFAHNTLFWPFDDPAAAIGTEPEKLALFRRVRDEIDASIRSWLESNGREP